MEHTHHVEVQRLHNGYRVSGEFIVVEDQDPFVAMEKWATEYHRRLMQDRLG